MGKDLKGKELGTGLRQKSNGVYSARYVDRFGNRKEIYDRNLINSNFPHRFSVLNLEKSIL